MNSHSRPSADPSSRRKKLVYGKDPNLIRPKRPMPARLPQVFREAIAMISAVMLGPSGTDRGITFATALSFFDEWLAYDYPDNSLDRASFISGIKSLRAKFGHRVSDWDAVVVSAYVRHVLAHGDEAVPDMKTFLGRFRYLLFGAYLTTQEGAEAIGYIGNRALDAPPEISAEPRDAIEQRLKALGI